MSNPLVSVVMPSYNSEKHIAESIQSIIDQTFTDWEFIIVDGHSKDKTIEIINSFVSKDSRIKLMFDEGKGIGPALNIGCKAAKGEYIARMDTDDVSMPDRLEKEVKYLNNHADSVLVTCSAQYIDENGKVLGYMFPYTHQYHLRKRVSSVLHPGVIMRKSAFEKSGGYPPISRSEDLMLWYKLINLGQIKILHKPLIRYRLSDTALSSTMSMKFNNEVNSRWKVYAQHSILTDEDLKEINKFISDNIIKEPTRVYPIRSSENKLFNILSIILPKDLSMEIVFFIKNSLGYFKS